MKPAYRLLTAILAAAVWLMSAGPALAGGDLPAAEKALRDHDYSAALTILRPLAEKGDAGAQYQLGTMYRLGEGVAVDDALAFKWLKKAAEQGHAQAQSKLGFIYAFGWGTPKNRDLAIQWWHKAARGGDPVAKGIIRQLEAHGNALPARNGGAR